MPCVFRYADDSRIDCLALKMRGRAAYGYAASTDKDMGGKVCPVFCDLLFQAFAGKALLIACICFACAVYARCRIQGRKQGAGKIKPSFSKGIDSTAPVKAFVCNVVAVAVGKVVCIEL